MRKPTVVRALAFALAIFLFAQKANAQSCAPNYLYYVAPVGPAALQYDYTAYVNNIVEYNRQVTCLNAGGASYPYNTDSKGYAAFLHFMGLGPGVVRDGKDVLQNTIPAKRAALGNDATELDVARAALADVVSQRDQPGNSTDPALRDAEYALRNYIGAQVTAGRGESDLSLSDIYEQALFQNPIATGAYNGWKAFSNLLGFGDVNQATPGNPNSPPGGFDAAVEGYQAGLRNDPVDSLYDYRVPQPAGTSPNNPISPIQTPLQLPPSTNIYSTPVSGNVPLYFDPPMSNYLEFYIGDGPLVSGIMIPSQDGLASTFSLLFGGNSVQIVPDEYFSFLSYYPYGANIFALDNLCAPSGCGTGDFLFSLQFTGSGNSSFATSSLAAPAGVPEPNSWLMMLLGFAGIGFTMQRKRTRDLGDDAARLWRHWPGDAAEAARRSMLCGGVNYTLRFS